MSNYKKLIDFQKNYPELTLNNKGYEKISLDIREKYKDQIKEISEILIKEGLKDASFDNFKIMITNDICIRCQYFWDETFKGVGYFNIEDFKKKS